MLILAIILMLLGFITCKGISPYLLQYLAANKLICKNYLHKEITSGVGLILFVSFVIVCSLMAVLGYKTLPVLFMFGCSFTTLAGLLDDIWGNNKHKGLKGHFKALFEGNLTTGCFKALTGLITAIIVGRFLSQNMLMYVLNIGLITLSTNSMNLFDLRPGRAIKYFLFCIILVITVLGINSNTIWLFSFFGVFMYYIPLDFTGKVMLGDTGSNLLGFILGYYYALIPIITFKIIIFTFLLGLQLYSERKSISKLISQTKFLYYLDQLGRPKI